MAIIVLSWVLSFKTSMRWLKALSLGADTASRTRFVCGQIVVSHARSSGVVIFMEIWCTRLFLVGVRVKVLHSCGMSYRSIGFPVWMLRKTYAARVRTLSYNAFQRGSLGITTSSVLVSSPTTL